MRILSEPGRIFYGIAIAGMGSLTVYHHDFPYMLLPPNHSKMPAHVMLAYIAGAFFILAGASIIFKIRIRTVSLLLAALFLLIVCFYHIPYEFLMNPNYMHIGEWENALKDLALSGGAFVIAGCFQENVESLVIRFLKWLIPPGIAFFCVAIIIFGTYHFLFAREASTLIPTWIPNPMIWTYVAGIALIGSGVAVSLNIKRQLMATLLGTMIFIWFIILHIPRVLAASSPDLGDEITSALLALAYSGTAFVIAGRPKK